MLSYLPDVVHASPAAASLPAGMIAVRAADLQIRPRALAGRQGAVVAGTAAAGTLLTFCHPPMLAGGRPAGGPAPRSRRC